MKRIVSIGAAVGIVLVGAATLFLVNRHADSDEIAQQVEEVLQTPQAYDGEAIDNLVRIGPDTIPAIGELLLDGYDWPMTLVYALRDMDDPLGAEPLLAYVRSMSPYDGSNGSLHMSEVLRVLGSFRNPIVCAPLTDIFEDVSSHPRLRLTSAATVYRSCEGEAAAEAEGLVLEFWSNRDGHMDNGIHETELTTALVATAESDEVADVLIGIMNTAPSHGVVPPIIETVDGDKDGFADGLMSVVNGRYVPFEWRLLAAQRLLDLDERPDDALHARLEELLMEAEDGGYPAEIIEEARRLSRDSESQLLD